MNSPPAARWHVAALLLLLCAAVFLVRGTFFVSPEAQTAQSIAPVLAATSSAPAATAHTEKTNHAPITHASSTAMQTSAADKALPKTSSSTTAESDASAQVDRIPNPYSFPPEPADEVNAAARGALVNVLCTTHGGSVKPISGSGVIIDPRGVILTNAHVAQYVLLSESPEVNLTCSIRSGSPATVIGHASVLYIPPVWVSAHASQLNTEGARGTGEHDFGLLIMDPNSGTFPYLPFDTRDAIGFSGDNVLVAAYPAEFLGGLGTENALYAATSIGTIGTLFTFAEKSVDAISLGSVIEAQSGSSGGAVVNGWGRLIGIVTTTSEGATTAERDLHAITLSYISSDIQQQTGTDLTNLLAGNLATQANSFNTTIAPGLLAQYFSVLHIAQ